MYRKFVFVKKEKNPCRCRIPRSKEILVLFGVLIYNTVIRASAVDSIETDKTL